MLNELMTDFSKDEWGIKRLQNCILNIAQYLHNFCENYGIVYCLMGGSALGAVRHKGFIPWDDDMDVFMTPDNYEKFRKFFNLYGDKDNFYLQEKGINGFVSTAKLRYNHSSYIEEAYEGKDINHGVFIDIFILHRCPDNHIKQLWQYCWARYVIIKGMADRGYYPNQRLQVIMSKLISTLPYHFLIKYGLSQLYRFRNCESSSLCHFMGHATIKNAIYKREYFDSVKKVKFEKIELYVPVGVEQYLQDRWGDYMRIPPKESIVHAQHCISWSDSVSFSNYNKEGVYTEESSILP